MPSAQTKPQTPIEPISSRGDPFTAIRSLDAQKAWLASRDIPNPYFLLHDGAAGARTIIEGRELLNFSSYNYLGLNGDAAVNHAAKEAIDLYGTSVSASRIVSGERPIHRELETELADFTATEEALVFVSGHGTNVSVIPDLVGPGDIIFLDAQCHNSSQIGTTVSGARRLTFPHNDWQALDRMLTQHRSAAKRALILIEGVYSMAGDVPDLPSFIMLKKRHDAMLMVDEAHSIGVLGATGRGLSEHAGVSAQEVDIWMGTMSKALASCGGFIAGRRELIEPIRYFSPGFMFSVGLPAPAAAAALAALRKLRAEPERAHEVRARAQQFRALARARGWNIGEGNDSAIVPLHIGDSARALRLSAALRDRGVNVQPIVYPAVPRNQGQLRFFFCRDHSPADIALTVDLLETVFSEPS